MFGKLRTDSLRGTKHEDQIWASDFFPLSCCWAPWRAPWPMNSPPGSYDTVAYQAQGRAVRGSGDHIAAYQGENYLFSRQENRELVG